MIFCLSAATKIRLSKYNSLAWKKIIILLQTLMEYKKDKIFPFSLKIVFFKIQMNLLSRSCIQLSKTKICMFIL